MDRISLLRQLIAQFDSGNQTNFARRISVSASQVNQWLSGHRKLGDAGARRIELALNLAPGYFGRGANIINLATREPADTALQDIIALARTLSPEGKYAAIGALQVLAREYPAAPIASAIFNGKPPPTRKSKTAPNGAYVAHMEKNFSRAIDNLIYPR